MWDEDKYQKSMTPEAIAYREGFVAGAEAMRESAAKVADDRICGASLGHFGVNIGTCGDRTGAREIAENIRALSLPTPTEKG